MIFDKGELYYIKFHDHNLSPDHILIECEVCVWILSQDDTRVTGTYWNVVQDDHKEGNDEPINIIKSTILKKRKLKLT